MEESTESILFSSIFSDDENKLRRKQELVIAFGTNNVFRNEYYVFYTISKENPKVVPNEAFLRLYLQTNWAVLENSRNIDMVNYRLGDTDPYVEFVNSCLAIYEECTKREVDDTEFYRALEMHKMNFVTIETMTVLEESALILSEGVKVGNKVLAGYEDMRGNLKVKMSKVDNIMNKTDRKGIITYGVTDADEEDEPIKMISDWGIEELNKALKGIYQGDMVSLLAPAKGTKTRLTTFILHNAVVNHGVNILMWSVENGAKGWEYLIRARHFNWFYNRNVTDATMKRVINSDQIRTNDMTPEIRDLELASWTDLKTNTDYGRISNVDEDFDFDTFIEVLEEAVNSQGITLLSVDYLQLVTGGKFNMNKNERIGEAYKKTLQFLKKKKIAGIFPAQLKQTVVGDLQRVDPNELINVELRDAAGESYEVIKTPDVNLMIYGTAEDIRSGSLKLLSIPSRNSASFAPIDMYVDAGSCTYASISKDV